MKRRGITNEGNVIGRIFIIVVGVGLLGRSLKSSSEDTIYGKTGIRQPTEGIHYTKSYINSFIPLEYSKLYYYLKSKLEEFDDYLDRLGNRYDQEPRRENKDLILGVNLGSANAHLGETLLTRENRIGNIILLDRFQDMGIEGVSIHINYPILLPNFPRNQEYLDYYKWLFQEIRRRGMVIVAKTGPMFRGDAFTKAGLNISAWYDSLTSWEQYFWGRRYMIQLIVNELRPDYLVVVGEVDTEEAVVNLPPPAGYEYPKGFEGRYLNPEVYEKFLRYILKDLDKGSTLIAAGIGTWDSPEYIKRFVKIPEIDCIELHIYPITFDYLIKAVTLAQIARANGKRVINSESWLYKANEEEVKTQGATWAEVFSRDVFDFWIPLDKKFHQIYVKLAKYCGYEYISPFWMNYYFAYLDYEKYWYKSLEELLTLAKKKAAGVILSQRELTPTGKEYQRLIVENQIQFGKRGAGKNTRIKNIKIIQQKGARPRFSPDGKLIVFDRKNPDGFYDVYIMDKGGKIINNLTHRKRGINQRHNGNAVFHPSGKYIVFISEEEKHWGLERTWLGDPGLGLYCNIWATTVQGNQFWKLTNIPIRQRPSDRIPIMGIVNPHFSPDGSKLVWTERYREGGGHLTPSWGRWRIKWADFVAIKGQPKLVNEEVLYEPELGNYVTSMGFVDEHTLLLAGNLDDQHEYGMDQYLYDIESGNLIANLTQTTEYWEEDASIAPDGKTIIYMSNESSRYPLDFSNPNWPVQPREREFWITDKESSFRERLTYFNAPIAPEYLNRRIIVAASDISPDGKYLVGTLGVDYGDEDTADINLKIVLIEFKTPLLP